MMPKLPSRRQSTPSPPDELAAIGSKLAGYSTQGPFHCEDCIHRDEEYCIHPVVIADPELAEFKTERGIHIDLRHGCCTYVRPQSRDASLLILRHGETEANKEDRFRGMEDYSLDESGQRMAREAGEWLKNHTQIKMICCSPLKRTKQTAAIVAQILGMDDVYRDKRLLPWNMGALAGKPKAEHADTVKYLVENPMVKAPESPEYGSESLNEFRQTFRPALEQYLHASSPDNQILLVSHGSAVIEAEFLLNEHDQPGEGKVVGPGGIMGVYERDGQYRAKPAFGKVKVGNFGV